MFRELTEHESWRTTLTPFKDVCEASRRVREGGRTEGPSKATSDEDRGHVLVSKSCESVWASELSEERGRRTSPSAPPRWQREKARKATRKTGFRP